MATLYPRKNVWWIAWGIPRQQKTTGLPLEKKAEAERLKRKVETDYRKQKELEKALLVPGKTFRAYRQNWIADLRKQGLSAARDYENWLKHVAVDLDDVHMQDIRPRHLEAAIKRVRGEKKLAPRSIRHIGGTLSVMFRTAYAEDIIPANPLPFRRGILPPKKDKDPAWRGTAYFVREELELLISSPLIPDDRRVRYAFFLLTGQRIGEASDRRWRDYDSGREPLGSLHVHSSYNTKLKLSKETKTGVARMVPVHPVLARALAHWRTHGAAEALGRAPTPDDLIVPGPKGGNLTSSVAWKRMQEDLRNLSLRTRRVHDGRRTFVSLALGDGAVQHVLERITHGPRGDVMSLYNTVVWSTLCEAVNHLKIRADVFATPLLPALSKVENS